MKLLKRVIFAHLLAVSWLGVGLILLTPAEAIASLGILLQLDDPIVHPGRNAGHVSANTTVSVAYNRAISPATVSTQTFAVQAMQTGLIQQNYGAAGGTISLTPPQPFKAGELVQVSATTGVLATDGAAPMTPTVWQFRVAASGGGAVFTDSGQSLGGQNSAAVALGDLNGDGDLDAFVANGDRGDSRPNEVWFNDGRGVFTLQQNLGLPAGSQGVALGDLDGDGDLDAFVVNDFVQSNDQPDRVWLNPGNGVFSDSGQALGNTRSQDVALGDVDGDGDLDAFVVVDQAGKNQIWLNDGAAGFSAGQAVGQVTSQSVTVALGDVDNDGDLDAFIGGGDGAPNTVWSNDGQGNFTDSGQTLGDGNTRAVALGDVDNDGDLDVLVGNGQNSADPTQIWANDGTGLFTVSQSLGTNAPGVDIAAALADVDGDGDLDAFISSGLSTRANKIWLNDGAGNFSDSNRSLMRSEQTRQAAFGDVDGDGDLDLFTANFAANRLWLNQNRKATANFGDTGQRLGNFDTRAVDLGDLDGDGDLDAFTAHENNQPDKVWFNNGRGFFSSDDSAGHNLGMDSSQTAGLGDVDNDGALDAVTGADGPNRVWRNDGSGNFSDGDRLGNEDTQAVALGDIDRNGSLDLIVGNSGDPNEVWLNDGSGNFSSEANLGEQDTQAVALGDLNRDNSLDIVFANMEANQVWLNDGAGNFTDTDQRLGTENSIAVALGDLDDDVDLDMIVGNSDQQAQIWLNDGAGNFTSAGQLDATNVEAIVLGDFDGDTDLDIGGGRGNGQGVVIWLNDGAGNFTTGGQPLGADNSVAVALGDLDWDGDLDLFIGNTGGQGDAVWLNDEDITSRTDPSIYLPAIFK